MPETHKTAPQGDGVSLEVQMTADLVIVALNIALHTHEAESVFHHSDQGSQLGFKESLQHQLVELQIRQY